MKEPFEGLFGDTCEARLLQFLLPMYGIEFDMAELTEEIQLTRQSVSRAMKKFSDKGMVKIRKEGRTWLYSINEDSPLVRRLEDFDNALIESMIGPEKFRTIRNYQDTSISTHAPELTGHGKETALYRDTGSGKVPVVSGRSGTYRAEGKPGKSGSPGN